AGTPQVPRRAPRAFDFVVPRASSPLLGLNDARTERKGERSPAPCRFAYARRQREAGARALPGPVHAPDSPVGGRANSQGPLQPPPEVLDSGRRAAVCLRHATRERGASAP